MSQVGNSNLVKVIGKVSRFRPSLADVRYRIAHFFGSEIFSPWQRIDYLKYSRRIENQDTFIHPRSISTKHKAQLVDRGWGQYMMCCDVYVKER